MKHTINQGNRDYAVRVGLEYGVYLFIKEYADEIGLSRSAAVRRLILIGARCEAEHGNATMPAAYNDLQVGSRELNEQLVMRMAKRERDERWED